MIPWPKPLTGIGNPLVTWLNRVLARAKMCTPIDVEGYRIEEGTDGYRLKKKFATTGGASAPASAEIAAFVITQLTGADYFIGNKLSNFTLDPGFNLVTAQASTTPTYIAKPVPARKPVVEVIDGIKITYRAPAAGSTLVGYADNNRIANDGQTDEVQVLYHRYVQVDDPTAVVLPVAGNVLTRSSGLITGRPNLIWCGGQSVIYAAKMDGGAGAHLPAPSNVNIEWIEISPSRVWAKRFAA